MNRKGNPVAMTVWVDGVNTKWLIDKGEAGICQTINKLITAARLSEDKNLKRGEELEIESLKEQIENLHSTICEKEAITKELRERLMKTTESNARLSDALRKLVIDRMERE